MQDELPAQNGPSNFTIAVLIIGTIAFFFVMLFRAAMTPVVSPLIGKQFPAIEAAGWINGPAPTESDFKGKVLVVDAWAYWCGPCRMAIPHLIELHHAYKDKGVVFLGLTSEGRDSKAIKQSEEFVSSLEIPWINGYGATKMLTELEVDSIPQVWVVDRENRIVFHQVGTGGSDLPMIQAIEKALEKK